MTGSTQELDGILLEYRGRILTYDELYRKQHHSSHRRLVDFEHANTVIKQALLDWHNKQVEEATDSVEAMVADIEFKAGINHVTMSGEWVHKDEVNKQIEAALDRLESQSRRADDCTDDTLVVKMIRVGAERNRLKGSSNDKDS